MPASVNIPMWGVKRYSSPAPMRPTTRSDPILLRRVFTRRTVKVTSLVLGATFGLLIGPVTVKLLLNERPSPELPSKMPPKRPNA